MLPLQKIDQLEKRIVDLPNLTGGILTSNELKEWWDSQPDQLRLALNAIIDVLQSTTDDSGAKNIGVKSIAGLNGNDVQAVLANLKQQMNNIVIGQIPEGSIIDLVLSDAEGQIKQRFNEHLTDKAHVHWLGNAGGTANALTFSYPSITEYKDGLGVSFAVTADSADATSVKIGNLTTIPVLKVNGSPVANFKKDGIYTARFSVAKAAFILQGEGGEYGTAQAKDVRKGTTLGTENGIVQGSLDLVNLTPPNLRRGVVIDGISGSLDAIFPCPAIFQGTPLINPTPIVQGSKTGNVISTFEISSGAVRLECQGFNNTYSGQIGFTSNIPLDLTNIDSIDFDCSFSTGSFNASAFKIGASSKKSPLINELVVSAIVINGKVVLDTRALSGMYYIAGIIDGKGTHASNEYRGSMFVTKIYAWQKNII